MLTPTVADRTIDPADVPQISATVTYADREHVDTLALTYRAGRGDLGELYRAVEPLFRPALWRTLRMHMPTTLDPDDIRQEAWLLIDRLARRWDPARGAFGAYVRVTFPYELHRTLQLHSPARRSQHVYVSSIDSEAWDDVVRVQFGTDGRDWDGQLAVAEMLETLDVETRRVVALRVLAGLTIETVADRLGITRPVAYGRCRRGLAALAGRSRGVVVSEDVQRLVAALYAATARRGRLPGRAAVCEITGLSETRYADLMRLLVTRGAIVDRSDRRTGRLAHQTAEETLAALGAVASSAREVIKTDAPPAA